jgi:hypothetical protein
MSRPVGTIVAVWQHVLEAQANQSASLRVSVEGAKSAITASASSARRRRRNGGLPRGGRGDQRAGLGLQAGLSPNGVDPASP